MEQIQYDADGNVVYRSEYDRIMAEAIPAQDFDQTLLDMGIAPARPFADPDELVNVPFFIIDAVNVPFSEKRPAPTVLCTVVAPIYQDLVYLSLGLQTMEGAEIAFRRGILQHFEGHREAGKPPRALGPCQLARHGEGEQAFIMVRSWPKDRPIPRMIADAKLP